jgi:chromosome partitioning protein
MNVIVFASRKGGSGKSTLAAHLSTHAHLPSRPCLLIDADPQGSLTLWHKLRGAGEPPLRVATRSVSEIVKAAKRDGCEWVFIDTQPTMNALVADALRAATLVIIPARPTVFDLMAVRDTIDLARELRKPYAVVINSAPPRRDGEDSPIVAQARQGLAKFKIPVWGGQITNRSSLAQALARGEGAREFDATSYGAAEVSRLWSAIGKSVEAIHGAHKTADVMHRAAA